MRTTIAIASVVIVAFLHFAFLAIEVTLWNTPFGRRITHLDEATARKTVGIGVNMGIYNGFLGFALLWVTFALEERSAYTMQWVLLVFIVIAGIVGAVTIRSPGIFVLQSIPALIAIGLIWAAHSDQGTKRRADRAVDRIERRVRTLGTVSGHPEPMTASDGGSPRAALNAIPLASRSVEDMKYRRAPPYAKPPDRPENLLARGVERQEVNG